MPKATPFSQIAHFAISAPPSVITSNDYIITKAAFLQGISEKICFFLPGEGCVVKPAQIRYNKLGLPGRRPTVSK